jgi:hypothetical protein
MELVDVRPSFQIICPSPPPSPSAHDRLHVHILLQFCSTLNAPVAQTGLKCAQSDEKRFIRRPRCTVHGKGKGSPL